jgi:hypothetical protein
MDAITFLEPSEKLCMTVTQLAWKSPRAHMKIGPFTGIGNRIPGWVRKRIKNAVAPRYITL